MVFSPVIDEEWQKTQCVPRETCVEVAKELGTTTNKFFKPPCVNVFRCGGCCNEESLSCMNTSTTYVSKTVNEPIYMHSLCPGSQRREGKEDVWFLKSCYERSVCSVITNRRIDFFLSMWSEHRHVQWHFTLMWYYYKCLYMRRDGKSGPEKVTVGSCDITGFNASLTYCYLELEPLESIGSWECPPPKEKIWDNLLCGARSLWAAFSKLPLIPQGWLIVIEVQFCEP